MNLPPKFPRIGVSACGKQEKVAFREVAAQQFIPPFGNTHKELVR
jgi:hypothetical protein